MKAISFLEYFKEGYKSTASDSEFISGTKEYSEKVSQPFSFEKVVELFEEFEINKPMLYLPLKDIAFELLNDEIYVLTQYSKYDDLEVDCELHNYVLCKTIDEFIVLCNNLNIELEWKTN